MSVDSTELQRATLERKKSDELNVIAAALGVKPGSRAKKADLVDLILQATGAAGTRTGSATPAGRDDGAAPEASPVATAPTDPAPAAEASAEDASAHPAPQAPAEPAGANGTPDAHRAPDANGATETNGAAGTSASDGSASRRRLPRSVGWTGDEGAGNGPASLFDSPSAAEARREAAAGRGAAGAPSNGSAAGTEADAAPATHAYPPARPSVEAETDRSGDEGRADEGRADEGRADEGRADENGRFDGETGGRRRRRRGRDRDRGDRADRPLGADRPIVTERPNGGDRLDRNDRNDRNDRVRDEARERFEDSSIEPVSITGYLDLRDEGYGFLRINGYLPSRDDAYVSVRQVRQFGLRRGDFLAGASRPAGHKEKNPALLRIDTVNGVDPELARQRPRFEDLTPLFPDERLKLEVRDDPNNMTARIIDLVAPIGKGQRGLIVSPPKAGKTTIMKQIARSIEVNHPEVHLIVLLVDERPEEVTDMKRWLQKGEVAASTFDRPAEEHIHVAELTIERAKRLVETGKDVCIILDGITRLARAYNLGAPASGRIMSGGIDTGALYPPKKFFGAARNVEEGGSLTILATALVDTGSRMDEVIFEEFKGTGNMELRLDRRMAERRVFPAIDVEQSSTRHEELLFDRRQLQQVYKLRRVLSGLRGEGGEGGAAAGLELLVDRLRSFRTNDEFLAEVAKGPNVA